MTETYCWRHKAHVTPRSSVCPKCADRGIITHLSAGPNVPPEGTIAAVETPQARLEYLRGELRAERISYGELSELQDLVPYIHASDVELLEAAGVPEFPAEPTRVIFRTFKPKRTGGYDPGGDVVAIFPDLPGSPTCDASVYQHVGQHGAADYQTMINSTRPATADAYAPLKKELESIGYVLQVITRKGRK